MALWVKIALSLLGGEKRRQTGEREKRAKRKGKMFSDHVVKRQKREELQELMCEK